MRCKECKQTLYRALAAAMEPYLPSILTRTSNDAWMHAAPLTSCLM